MNTQERARGRWKEILPQLGVAPRFLVNKHGPCPCCGGKDRWRFDDKNGDGTWFCNQEGSGNGLSLVKKLKGWDHRTACEEIDKLIGTERRTKHYVQQPVGDDAKRLDACRKLLDEATEPSVVTRYLDWRGLKSLERASLPIVGHPALDFWEASSPPRLVGQWPAVLAPIIGPEGDLVSVQRLYLRDERPNKKTMPPAGTINGAAVRLLPYGDELGVAEGVATALAAYLLFGIPTWAALSAHGLETFVLPGGVQRLHIFADNDENYEGQAAAANLARRVSRQSRKPGSTPIDVKVNTPSETGTDWLDVLHAR